MNEEPDARVDDRASVVETRRLALRELHAGDAAFILDLVNDPGWLRFIGDKGVRTLADARRYIADGPAAMYARFGFGLWLVASKEDGASVGMCGLVKRDGLDDVDLGFAFLAAHRRKGYAFESASAVAAYARTALGLARIVAITSDDNVASARLLEKLGFRFERMARLRSGDDEVRLYAIGADGGRAAAATRATPTNT
jgi:RimJ/RimL family protein N-acetyltransferase